MYYYYLPEPPYFLIVFGLLAGISCGLAFEATLKEKVAAWSQNPTQETVAKVQGFDLKTSFWGICAGVCIFLASGLEIFSVDRWLAYTISLVLTLLIANLVWSQLGQLLILLQQGGSKALDLDAFE